MSIPSLRKQIFGDVNKQLNQVRRKMNDDIMLKCLTRTEKRKENANILENDNFQNILASSSNILVRICFDVNSRW